MHHVELIIEPSVNTYHLSMINTGLVALADRGEITLTYRRARGSDEAVLVADSLAINLRIDRRDGNRPRHVVIDLHDQSNIFAGALLKTCDLYFKRSFHQPDVDRLGSGVAGRVVPFGLNFACRSRSSTFKLLNFFGAGIAASGLAGMKKLRFFLALPSIADYEQEADSHVEPTVVFQTRVWEADETAVGEAEAINQDRVEIVRALRLAFGDRYQGGLMPTPLAFSSFSDAVTSQPARRKAYTAMSKKNLIGVYTRGLFESTAFKLPEYLAAAQCIVAEEPRNQLPTPLLAGANYLSFRTASECVAACERLLFDKALAKSMRRANRAYYLAEVEPAARLRRIIEQATECQPARASTSRLRTWREKVVSK